MQSFILMDIPNVSVGEEDDKSTDKSPDRLPDGVEWSDLPLFIWKWQFRKHFNLTGPAFRALMTPDLVEHMGVAPEEWRYRQKIFRKELPPLMSEFNITAEEMVKISQI